jgi:hypothetical protein
MFRRVVLGIIHSLATTAFTVMEVLGIPRVREKRGEQE